MFDDPIRQRLFKADIPAGLLRFDPLVSEYFFAFRLKLAIK